MAYACAEAGQELRDAAAEATDHLGGALAALGDAYDQLDEDSGDRLEAQLFRPVQHAYGRAKRTHAEFAQRHGLPGRTFAPAVRGHPSQGVKGFVEGALEAVDEADIELSTLQASLLPVEVGDPELRSGLAEVRTLLGELRPRAERFVGLLGR